MADEKVEAAGQSVSDQTQTQAGDGDNQGKTPDAVTGAPADADNARYLVNYKTREEAERGYLELQRKLTEVATEKAEAAARLEMLEKQLKQTATHTGPDYESRIKDIVKSIADKVRNSDDPQAAMAAEMVNVQRGMVLDAMEAVERKHQQELDALRQEMSQYDPTYVSHKKEIDDISKTMGVDKAKAKQFYEQFVLPTKASATQAAGNGATNQRAQKPGTPKGGAAGSDGDDVQVELPAHEVARVAAFGLGPESTKNIIESMKKELKAKSKRSA